MLKKPLSIRAKALVFVDPRSGNCAGSRTPGAAFDPVLIRGETGSGKELLARHIHRASDRGGLFVSVNCGAISPTYADAELFGYAAGSYSGSASSRAGWFGSANGGTLYLDEIGDLPLPIQVKLLLAALENHEVTRVGAHQPSPVDVRLVAATSIDLAQAVAAGKSTSGSITTSAKASWNCRPCASGSAISCRWPNTSSASTASAWSCRCR
jgi:hypothetical protein